MANQRPILLVEDDRVDAMTVKRAIRQIKMHHPLIHAENGEEALEYLNNSSNEKPWIILLDLNMPKMNGIEFLQVAKRNDAFKSIPVVVLTTSKEQQDRIETFKFGVAGYMVKPVDYSQFVEMMQAIKMYWSLSQQPD
ncbi:MAG: CheY-like chemotaxis protein [Saprospiraceae bacterium]|jgi:CheY-like chemotaxis protein